MMVVSYFVFTLLSVHTLQIMMNTSGCRYDILHQKQTHRQVPILFRDIQVIAWHTHTYIDSHTHQDKVALMSKPIALLYSKLFQLGYTI